MLLRYFKWKVEKQSQILPNYYNFWGLTLILSLTQINMFHCFAKADLQLRPQPSVLKTWTFSVEEKCKTDRVWTTANNQVSAQTQAQAWLNCMLIQFQVKDLWASPPWLKGQISFFPLGLKLFSQPSAVDCLGENLAHCGYSTHISWTES